MGFGSIIRDVGLPLVDKLTGGDDGFQDTVMWYPWTGSDDYSAPTYGSAVPIAAIVEEKMARVTLSSGDVVTQKASFTIPRPLTANGAAERKEPVDPRDKFVLPSGYTGPVLDVAGPTDPKTHAPFMFTIVLG